MNDPEIFKGRIASEDGEALGGYTAFHCETFSALFRAQHFAADDCPLLRNLTYPVAYLHTLRVESRRHRRQGKGSLLLEQFRISAREKGAQSAFARISDPETPKDVLVKFYTRNGWEITPVDEVDFPRFAKLDLSI